MRRPVADIIYEEALFFGLLFDEREALEWAWG
jgi:hypothetical protein